MQCECREWLFHIRCYKYQLPSWRPSLTQAALRGSFYDLRLVDNAYGNTAVHQYEIFAVIAGQRARSLLYRQPACSVVKS